jgi:hypothetical protein
MADAKTQPTTASVAAFIAALPDARQQADCRALVQLMTRATGEPPVLWGRNIVGFGRYRYRYASGTRGDWPLAAFAPRGRELTLYFMDGFDTHAAALKKLGPHKHAKACLYVKSIDGLDRAVLASMVAASVRTLRSRGPADDADVPQPAARPARQAAASTQRAAGGAIPGKATPRTASAGKTATKKTAAARTNKAASSKPATTARSKKAAPAKRARRTPAARKIPAKTAQQTGTPARRVAPSRRR